MNLVALTLVVSKDLLEALVGVLQEVDLARAVLGKASVVLHDALGLQVCGDVDGDGCSNHVPRNGFGARGGSEGARVPFEEISFRATNGGYVLVRTYW